MMCYVLMTILYHLCARQVTLGYKELFLLFYSSVVLAEVAIGADHPVTRYSRVIVLGQYCSYGPYCTGASCFVCNLCIGQYLTFWNAPYHVINPLGKRFFLLHEDSIPKRKPARGAGKRTYEEDMD